MDYQLIADFFHRYGSKIKSEASSKTDFGVLSPIKNLEAGLETIRYDRAGYQMKSEYLLLTLNHSGIVSKGEILQINDKKFCVLNTDYYYYANQPLYLRAYLARVENVESKEESE